MNCLFMIIISSFYVTRINIKSYYNRKSSSQSFKTGVDGLRSQFKGLKSVNLGRSIRAGWDFFFQVISKWGKAYIQVWFCHDIWCGNCPLKDFYPKFACLDDKKCINYFTLG